jgi:hypothetical protein
MRDRRLLVRFWDKKMVDEYGIKFLETSSKSNVGVDEAFNTLIWLYMCGLINRDVRKRLVDITEEARIIAAVELQDAKDKKDNGWRFCKSM